MWIYKQGKTNLVADRLSRCLIVNKEQYEKEEGSGRRVPLPPLEEDKLLEKVHISLAHPAISTFCEAIRPFYIIKNLKDKIQKIKKECKYFQIYRRSQVKYGLTSGSISKDEPFKHLSSDIYGPIST